MEVQLIDLELTEELHWKTCLSERLRQVPLGAWHSIIVYEPSIIMEAKNGVYGNKIGKRIVREVAMRFCDYKR